MADDQTPPPFSEVVREHGEYASERALDHAGLWRAWAEQLDELIRDMPASWTLLPPRVHANDGDKTAVPMGAAHVDLNQMRARLYRIVADADAVAGALTRAAGLAAEMSEETVNAYAIDEAEAAEGRESRGGGQETGLAAKLSRLVDVIDTGGSAADVAEVAYEVADLVRVTDPPDCPVMDPDCLGGDGDTHIACDPPDEAAEAEAREARKPPSVRHPSHPVHWVGDGRG